MIRIVIILETFVFFCLIVFVAYLIAPRKSKQKGLIMEQLYKETAIVSENMQKYGGSFASRLGAALQYADIHNIIKIKTTWSELWNIYLNWGNNDGK